MPQFADMASHGSQVGLGAGIATNQDGFVVQAQPSESAWTALQ